MASEIFAMAPVLLQAIPAHRLSVQLGGAVVFVLLLLGIIALFRRVSRQAQLEHAEALIAERWSALEEESPEPGCAKTVLSGEGAAGGTRAGRVKAVHGACVDAGGRSGGAVRNTGAREG